MSKITDIYYKKTVHWKINDARLKFRVSQNLFSSAGIDIGSSRLVRRVVDQADTVSSLSAANYHKILDIGCGYGAVGLALKSHWPQSELHLVDKDALALQFAAENAKQNGLASNTHIYASLGLKDVVGKDFDLIVSNVPAKVGPAVLQHMLLDGHRLLAKNGSMAVVVISPIANQVNSILRQAKANIIYQRKWSSHEVFHYQLPGDCHHNDVRYPGIDLYKRDELKFSYGGQELTIETTYNLPEFDQLSIPTAMLLAHLPAMKKSAAAMILNPNQGVVPLAVVKTLRCQEVHIVDRDLQSLEVSKHNLLQTKLPLKVYVWHQADLAINQRVSTVIGVLPEKQPTKLYELWLTQLREQSKESGQLLLAGSSTLISRVIAQANDCGWRLLQRSKSHGYSVASWQAK